MRPTRADVAKLAGTSGTTVSLVLSGAWKRYKISEKTRDQVLAAVRRLGYVPNRAAQELKFGVSRRVSLLLPDLSRQFHWLLLNAIQKEAAGRGLALMLHFAGSDAERAQALEQAVAQSDALLLCAVEPSAEEAERLESAALPVVRVQTMPSQWRLRIDTVTLDHAKAVNAAVDLLVKRGYTDLYFTSRSAQRQTAIRAALRRHGFSWKADHHLISAGDSYEDGERLACALAVAADGTTGILADNDAVALGCMAALERRDILAGRHYGLIGFDDFPASAHLRVPLTTLRLPYERIASHAFELIDAAKAAGRRRRKPRVVSLDFQLIERTSTRH